MSEHKEGHPKESTIPPLDETDNAPSEEQLERQSQSPEPNPPSAAQPEGVPGPAAGTSPIGDEGQVKGQTQTPADADDVGAPPHEDNPHPDEGDKPGT